jgi:hypothetical protein
MVVIVAVVVVLEEELSSLIVGESDQARRGDAIVELLREEEQLFMVTVGFSCLGGSRGMLVYVWFFSTKCSLFVRTELFAPPPRVALSKLHGKLKSK